MTLAGDIGTNAAAISCLLLYCSTLITSCTELHPGDNGIAGKLAYYLTYLFTWMYCTVYCDAGLLTVILCARS